MTRRRSNYDESCWSKRSGLELALIGVLLTSIVFAIALAVLLTVQVPSSPICSNPQCIIEASQISQRVDTAINPCEDFQKFSCGSSSEIPTNNDDSQNYISEAQQITERQLAELFGEPFQEGEYPTVSFAKNLFKACMDEDAIEMDGLATITEVLQAIGGWPVVDELYWDDTKFNWVKATYKLRSLGYPFAYFLDLSVTVDPRNSSRYVFEVSIPVQQNHFSVTDQDTRQFMADVAVLFGANTEDALTEMGKTTEFMKKLSKINNSSLSFNKLERMHNVNDFHQKLGNYVNWLEFINTIINPASRIFAEDYVIFPDPDVLNKWFYLISKTSKRDQANYMVWKLIETTAPYLTKKLASRKMKPTLMPSFGDNEETRLTFCLREVQERFSPNPLNLIYFKKYFTADKKKRVESIIQHIKTKFLENIDAIFWLDIEKKEEIMEKVQQMMTVIGIPAYYFDDTILDDWTNYMPEIQADNFLYILSQANRHSKTNHYKQVHKLTHEAKLLEWYLGTASMLPYIEYNFRDDVMRIPVTMLQGAIFNEDRPNYFNYAMFGTLLANEFVEFIDQNSLNAWTNEIIADYNKTIESIETKMRCITKDVNFSLNEEVLSEVKNTLAVKISYEAYKKWLAENGEEPTLIATRYTPEQLFWITSTYMICQANKLEKNFAVPPDRSNRPPLLAFYSNFGDDFSCSEGSPMKQPDECRVFSI